MLNWVSSIKENGTVNLATYSYDDLSRRASVTLGNSNIMSYAYNGDDTLQSLTHNLQGATTTNDVTLGYGYNQVDQINARSYTNNAYLWNGHYNVTRPYAANGLNQYTTSGSKTLTYDARGSLTGDGTWSFAYDVENRLKSATRTGLTGSFLYDPVGRLNQQTVTGTIATKFLYDGDDMVAEYGSAGALLRRYIHGPGIDEPLAWYEGTALATKRYFQADHQGSIIAVTDGTTGAPISQFSYGPYGEPNTLTGSPFRYTGQRLVPGVGFYYYKARFYSPYLGRFLQTDPIGVADDFNMYAYVGNSPISSRDPSGLFGTADAVFKNTLTSTQQEALATGKLGYEQYAQENAVEQFSKAAGDFSRNYRDMRDANTINGDKYFHCKANCEAASRGSTGQSVAEKISNFRESTDQRIKGDPLSASQADQAANRQGRSGGAAAASRGVSPIPGAQGTTNENICRATCGSLRPRGLPEKY